jgi:hypothetical protein
LKGSELSAKLSLLLVILILIISVITVSATPSLISYQGRLLGSDGLPVFDGSHEVSFGLYSDSTSGNPLWAESAMVITSSGLFSHLLGSITPIPSGLWLDREAVFLELAIEGIPQTPRSRISAVPYAAVAGNLELVGDSGATVIRTDGTLGGSLNLSTLVGDTGIVLHGGYTGDSAVILPDSSINADETLDEAGFTASINSYSMDLQTVEMIDLAVVRIEPPTDGYVILDGKCYVELSGTTGPNVALIQIDDEEGGSTEFPYYTLAGMSGYANSGSNYFPVYVTRIYWVEAAVQYEFRMEGRANYPAPAKATTWDHVLRATFLPTGYGYTSKVTTDPGDHPSPRLLNVVDPMNPDSGVKYYEIDLRYYEQRSRTNGFDR